MLQQTDKEFLKQNIFLALDSVIRVEGEPSDQSNKSITTQIENVIWNIAQYDYTSWNQGATSSSPSPLHSQIQQRLVSTDVRYKISGLRALKSLIQAFEFEIDIKRKPLHHIVEIFFPIIESSLLADNSLIQDPNYAQIILLICKIFFMCIQVS